jgi:hypothetical protein
MEYRFPHWKDATWNSFERQQVRYQAIRPLLGTSLIGAEIGVYKGGFGEFLLPHCSKLYLVDPWYRSGGMWDSGLERDSRVDTVIQLLTAYKREIEEGRIEVVVEYSQNFLRSMSDAYFDFLYIDSSHRYEDTIAELHAAYAKLRKGGLLLGDDYDPDPASHQHGVFRAVNQFASEIGARLVLNKTRQWALALSG